MATVGRTGNSVPRLLIDQLTANNLSTSIYPQAAQPVDTNTSSSASSGAVLENSTNWIGRAPVAGRGRGRGRSKDNINT
jgi:hypothetical protein